MSTGGWGGWNGMRGDGVEWCRRWEGTVTPRGRRFSTFSTPQRKVLLFQMRRTVNFKYLNSVFIF